MGADQRQLGPYILREAVSSRALTVTYRAEHAGLGRAALIKTLKPTVSAASAFAAGLEREAKILARIRHPNIIDIHDFQRDEDRIWLVLEPLSGPTLAALCARAGRLDEGAAAAIAREIARGLGHAHERGVVHRELRPERVIVTPAGGVKILEFAAASDGRQPSLPEPFEGSDTFARPDYMAPEQILGAEPGPQADVFALGVVLFEMLTGVRPFDEPKAGPEDANRTSNHASNRASNRASGAPGAPRERDEDRWAEGRAVAHRIRNAPPQPLRGLVPDVSRGLERVVLRCLEKEPEQRYDSGRAVADALAEELAERGQSQPRALITRALAAAKLGGDELPPAQAPSARPAAEQRSAPSLAPDVGRLVGIFALVVAGGALIELSLRPHDAAEPPSAEVRQPGGRSEERGYLKVLARPWAEVVIDGELIDVTPMARAIPLQAGRHYVTFRHPNAPEEKRTITVSEGQTVTLDVSMRIDRGAIDAGAPPVPDRDASP
ncbi:serine/threonine-protein kinase [Sorangium sp. So ce367]|uniref:serine/threonine protein kinase n=1 Tax=Sorangium sp. So ce367 TaxID=3133305 RepID=UPI003F608C43